MARLLFFVQPSKSSCILLDFVNKNFDLIYNHFPNIDIIKIMPENKKMGQRLVNLGIDKLPALMDKNKKIIIGTTNIIDFIKFDIEQKYNKNPYEIKNNNINNFDNQLRNVIINGDCTEYDEQDKDAKNMTAKLREVEKRRKEKNTSQGSIKKKNNFTNNFSANMELSNEEKILEARLCAPELTHTSFNNQNEIISSDPDEKMMNEKLGIY